MYKKLIYVPKEVSGEDPKPEKATVVVKFSQNTYLLKSFLDAQGIEYVPEDLQETPLGPAYIIERKND